jgi:septum formation protein
VTTAAGAPRLILGSASPRRVDLLAQAGLTPAAICPPDIDETPAKAELPLAYVRRMAREKARAVPAGAGEVVLAADTTVALGRRILGKPADAAAARDMLMQLSGRRHRVITAICVKSGDRLADRAVTTQVMVKRLTPGELDAYLATGEWQGKAGSYGIQGAFGAYVPWINGSITGVIGLPLAETLGLLKSFGVEP